MAHIEPWKLYVIRRQGLINAQGRLIKAAHMHMRMKSLIRNLHPDWPLFLTNQNRAYFMINYIANVSLLCVSPRV